MSNIRINPGIMGGVATGHFSFVRVKNRVPAVAKRRFSLRSLLIGAVANGVLWVGIVVVGTKLLV